MRLRTSTAMKLRTAVCAGETLVCLGLGAAVLRAHSGPQAVHAARETTASGEHRPDAETAADLTSLAYELLDAHADTASLAASLASDPAWAAHLDYLRSLQRAGRALLARPSITRPSRRLSR